MKGKVALISVFTLNWTIIAVVITTYGVLGYSRRLLKGKPVPGVSAQHRPLPLFNGLYRAREFYFRWDRGQGLLWKTVKLSMTRAAGCRALQTGKNPPNGLSLVQRSSLTGHSFPKYQHADRNRTSSNRLTRVTQRQTWNSGQGVSRGDIEQGKTIHG